MGSGHATLALRADWQRHLKRCHDELGFRHVRFHGILSDDMSTFNLVDKKPIYSFFNANQIMDFLRSIGMRPFVELSFMPTALASGKSTVFHYQANITPPKDWNQWRDLITQLVKNWVERYGLAELNQWFFEVWNEPNLSAFWTGTREDYFNLFENTAQAIRVILPEAKIGGPATAKNEWIPEFLTFCDSKNIHPDFISTHHYPTDAFGQASDDTLSQLKASHPAILREQAVRAKSQCRGIPLYYTEWNTSSNPSDVLHDQPFAAAHILRYVLQQRDVVEGYSYWTFSDIFEENYFSQMPFHGGFGLLNSYGIPKPPYRAYQLLHHFGDSVLEVDGDHPTVQVYASTRVALGSEDGGPRSEVFKIICVNSTLPGHDIHAESVQLRLRKVGAIRSSYIERIDETHANPRRVWELMGSPDNLLQKDVAKLEEASEMMQEKIEAIMEEDRATFMFTLPPQATLSLTVERA